MTNLRKLIVLAGLVGLCSSSDVRADMASGSFTNTFNNGLRLWDISGSYNANTEGLGFGYTINMDQSGKFNGQGSIAMTGLTNVSLAFWGTVRNVSSNVTRVNISVRLKAAMELGTEGLMYVRATVNEKLEVDTSTMMMVGIMSGSGSVSIPALHRSASQRIPPTEVTTPLPAGMTGNWQLALNVQTNGTHYTGDGEVTLSNGRTIPVVTTGSYGVKNELSRLTVKSFDTTNGIVNLSLTSTVAGGQLQIQRLVGRALGQTLRSISSQ
jgi:hypothetical protein